MVFIFDRIMMIYSSLLFHGERVEREPITGVWGQSPQQGPGAEPLVGGSGGA